GTYQRLAVMRLQSSARPSNADTPAPPSFRHTRIDAAITGHTTISALTGRPGRSSYGVTDPSAQNGSDSARISRKKDGSEATVERPSTPTTPGPGRSRTRRGAPPARLVAAVGLPSDCDPVPPGHDEPLGREPNYAVGARGASRYRSRQPNATAMAP